VFVVSRSPKGGIRDTVLFAVNENDNLPDGDHLVLDNQRLAPGILQPIDFDIRGHAHIENHREHQSVRREIRQAHGTANPSSLLRDRLRWMYVGVVHVRLYRPVAEYAVGPTHLRVDFKVKK